jgi:hypothetical protein
MKPSRHRPRQIPGDRNTAKSGRWPGRNAESQRAISRIKDLRPNFPSLASREIFAPSREVFCRNREPISPFAALSGNHQGTARLRQSYTLSHREPLRSDIAVSAARFCHLRTPIVRAGSREPEIG